MWKYSYKPRGEKRASAKAVIRNVPVHPKVFYELLNTIRGRKLEDAINYVERVIEMKEAVPFRRYSGKQAHKRGLGAKWGWPAGRYPVKAAMYLLKLLENVRNNAENQGIEVEKARIVHIAAHKGIVYKRFMPRAYGRVSPKNRVTSNVEVVVEEVG